MKIKLVQWACWVHSHLLSMVVAALGPENCCQVRMQAPWLPDHLLFFFNEKPETQFLCEIS